MKTSSGAMYKTLEQGFNVARMAGVLTVPFSVSA